MYSLLDLDSAFFGPTFPHLFYMTFDKFITDMEIDEEKYVPKVFGFKVHSSSSSLPSSSMS